MVIGPSWTLLNHLSLPLHSRANLNPKTSQHMTDSPRSQEASRGCGWSGDINGKASASHSKLGYVEADAPAIIMSATAAFANVALAVHSMHSQRVVRLRS